MEDALDELETLVGIAQTIAMRQEEDLAIELGGLRLLVEDDATLLFQIAIGPDIVVAREIMHLDTHIGEFGYTENLIPQGLQIVVKRKKGKEKS